MIEAKLNPTPVLWGIAWRRPPNDFSVSLDLQSQQTGRSALERGSLLPGQCCRYGDLMLTRRELLAYGSAGLAAAAAPAAGAAGGGRLLRLPLDHTQPAGPQIEIGYEWGKPFRADQRTVLLVVDGQQFYLRPGAAADLQSKLFGDGVNLLAFFGRASSPQLRDYVRPTGKIDWHRAAHVLNIHQWIGDLKAVADALELPSGALGLYGRSGGADLTLRFLASHPSRASYDPQGLPPSPLESHATPSRAKAPAMRNRSRQK